MSSGLAYGIDEAAHQGASAHQRTIAVTGTGLDSTYPAQNKKLAEHILAQNGAIITEFLPGTPPLQQHFPRRNRIVSGLSLGVLVVEATLKVVLSSLRTKLPNKVRLYLPFLVIFTVSFIKVAINLFVREQF